MSLGSLCLAIYLILQGLVLLGILSVSNVLLGILALIAGIALLVEAYHPLTVFRRS
jgi:hypothetical protein